MDDWIEQDDLTHHASLELYIYFYLEEEEEEETNE